MAIKATTYTNQEDSISTKDKCSFKKDGLYSYIYTIQLDKKSSFNLETQYELTYQRSFN